jgi:hypothetical protein
MELIYLGLNFIFEGDDVFVDSEIFLMTDFMNLKIKLAQSFRGIHRNRIYVCIYKCECLYIYKYLYLYCVSKKDAPMRENQKQF